MDRDTGAASASVNQKAPAASDQQDEGREDAERKRNNIRKRTKTGCLSELTSNPFEDQYATIVSNLNGNAKATTNELSSKILWAQYREGLLDLLSILKGQRIFPATYTQKPLPKASYQRLPLSHLPLVILGTNHLTDTMFMDKE
ncbi:hypothetical protein ACHAP5_002248 [Fusarium lateritium]